MANNITTEMTSILKYWQIWCMLGTQDIKLKYRRSSLGPFWITISMAVTIYSLGFLYGHLFKVNMAQYLPYLASGIIGWALISTLIIESSQAFIEAECYIKNQESFLSLFLMRLLLRNLISFAHNLIALIPMVFFLHIKLGFNCLSLIPSIILISINFICWGTLIATIGTRFRDFSQLIINFTQVIFFLTPVMWMPHLLPKSLHWIIAYNPFNHILNLIRMPLMNQTINAYTYAFVGGITLAGISMYFLAISKYKHRIVYWI